jgi:hypothetical protein
MSEDNVVRGWFPENPHEPSEDELEVDEEFIKEVVRKLKKAAQEGKIKRPELLDVVERTLLDKPASEEAAGCNTDKEETRSSDSDHNDVS